MCVYCAFAVKQNNPNVKIVEVDSQLMSMMDKFKSEFEHKFKTVQEHTKLIKFKIVEK